ncbi:DUF1415 domain-containing protein [Algibacillus agarilyticus]|uniref:DUF1415 domain-containing protein n=1 Tax=Algibacillus agarilyticus TaxID=2234133 RepID=UPI000DD055DE|nr:DUF1415 domain-containing protein [Algibacillus agarilyticus]
MNSSDIVTKKVQTWLTEVVIGLNLCPFANQPYIQQKIKFQVSSAQNLEQLTEELEQTMQTLHKTPSDEVETLLFIVPRLLKDFYEYNDYLEIADQMLENNQLTGIFQIASFHPNYRFDGLVSGSVENLTNRAPYPIFHFLREETLTKVIDSYPDVDAIPDNNIEKMHALSKTQIRTLFPFLN